MIPSYQNFCGTFFWEKIVRARIRNDKFFLFLQKILNQLLLRWKKS